MRKYRPQVKGCQVQLHQPLLPLSILTLSPSTERILASRDRIDTRNMQSLAPCPKAPNCVSSQATDPRNCVEPLRSTASPDIAWSMLTALVDSLARTRIVEQSEHYLRAEVRSRVFRFVDDVEFLALPAEGLIHVRSASRVGHSDLGVNRRRVEHIRRKLLAMQRH